MKKKLEIEGQQLLTEERRKETMDRLESIQNKIDLHLDAISGLAKEFQNETDYFYQNFSYRDPSMIGEALEELVDKLWYHRHKDREQNIFEGKETCDPEIWEGALKSAKRIEEKYGKNILVDNYFQWGMLNGKISALRWVTGDDWDVLDS